MPLVHIVLIIFKQFLLTDEVNQKYLIFSGNLKTKRRKEKKDLNYQYND